MSEVRVHYPTKKTNFILARQDGAKGQDHAYPGVAPPSADEKDKVIFKQIFNFFVKNLKRKFV